MAEVRDPLIIDYCEIYIPAAEALYGPLKFIVIGVVHNQNGLLFPGRHYHEVTTLVHLY